MRKFPLKGWIPGLPGRQHKAANFAVSDAQIHFTCSGYLKHE